MGTGVKYHEKFHSLGFRGNSEYVMYVPSKSLWERRMPEYFKWRREEILGKIAKKSPKQLRFEEFDAPDQGSVHYARRNAKGQAIGGGFNDKLID
ncbi:MAG: hypothetical protein JWM68_1111 [Verrucomicrobiales bacterium]|nr:hypothetical protein [Verrucomicrobiales bacterium]